MDWFSVVSMGAYPTPTPTGSERAAYAVTWGLLDTLYAAEEAGPAILRSIFRSIMRPIFKEIFN